MKINQGRHSHKNYHFFKTEINNLKELLQEQVKGMIFDSPNKFCKLDPMPTWMIRDCIEEVLPLVTKIINLSLRFREIPDDLNDFMILLTLWVLGT